MTNKQDIILSKVKSKYGLHLPKYITEAEHIDEDNNNIIWMYTSQLEMNIIMAELK